MYFPSKAGVKWVPSGSKAGFRSRETLEVKKLSMRMLRPGREFQAFEGLDSLRQPVRLENLLEEHHSHAEDANRSIASMTARIEELEESHGLQYVRNDEAFSAHMEQSRARDARRAF